MNKPIKAQFYSSSSGCNFVRLQTIDLAMFCESEMAHFKYKLHILFIEVKALYCMETHCLTQDYICLEQHFLTTGCASLFFFFLVLPQIVGGATIECY